MNYICLDKAFRSPSLDSFFDPQHSLNHDPQSTYEGSMLKVQDMQARGSTASPREGCMQHIDHLTKCYTCSCKLKDLIKTKMQKRHSSASMSKKDKINILIVIIVILMCLIAIFAWDE